MPIVQFSNLVEERVIEARVVVPRRAKVISEYPTREEDRWNLVGQAFLLLITC
jgi:hypothetical protein